MSDEKPIYRFRGPNQYFSNFYPECVEYEGIEYPSVEHAFQAAKTLDVEQRRAFARLNSPAAAKQLGRKVTLRADWDGMKLGIMEALLRLKFPPGGHLTHYLLKTSPRPLVEGNDWHDRFWGHCFCSRCEGQPGENHLGRLLMKIRDDLCKTTPKTT